MAGKKKQKKSPQKSSDKAIYILLKKNVHFVAMYTFVLVVLVGNLSLFSVTSTKAPVAPNAHMVLAMQDRKVAPQLKPREFLSYPALSAHGGFVVDVDSGKTLFEKNADYPMLPASTVKMMTALVALEEYDLGDIVTFDGTYVEGQKLGLVAGEQVYIHDLIASTLIYSANDAAEALARFHPSGRDSFITLMNQKAKVLGVNNTYFINPTGLDNVGQTATPEDLARIAKEGLSNEYFSYFIRQKDFSFESVDGLHKHSIRNTNTLLGQVEGVQGVKTGWTENAQENLITYVDRGDKRILTVLLGSQDRFGETETLIEWIYDNYDWNGLDSYIGINE